MPPEVKIPIDATGNAAAVIQRTTDATDELAQAMARLVVQERNNKILEEAKKQFADLTAVEKKYALEAYDAAEAQRKASEQTKKVTAASRDAQSGIAKYGGQLNDLVQGLTGFNLAQLSAAGLIVGAANAAKQAVQGYSDYVTQIDKASMATGMSAEETSKLIQVADDFRVEQDALTRAMMMALKNGFTPSVESIAQLSDKYLSIQDPAKRAEEMSKLFGRSWFEIVPLLQQGGDAIRKAAAEMSGGLVVTDEAIIKNRIYVKSLDDLGDAWKGIQYVWADVVVGPLADLIKGEVKAEEAIQNGRNALFSIFPPLRYLITLIQEVNGASDERKQATKEMLDGIEKERLANKGLGAEMEDLAETEKKVTQEAVNHYNTRANRYRASIDRQVEDNKLLQESYKGVMSEIATIAAGSFGNEDKSFEEKQAGIRSEIQKTTSELYTLMGLPYVSQEQQKQIDDLVGKLGGLQTELNKTAVEHEKAMKKMAFDMIMQRVASDGLTENEVNNMGKIAVAWGLWDQKTADVVTAVNGNIGQLDTKTPDHFLDTLEGIMGVPSEKNFTYTVSLAGQKASRATQGAGASSDIAESLTQNEGAIASIDKVRSAYEKYQSVLSNTAAEDLHNTKLAMLKQAHETVFAPSVQSSIELVQLFKAKLEEIPTSRTTVLRVVAESMDQAYGIGAQEKAYNMDLNGNGVIGAKNGAYGIVPPGHPNDTYLQTFAMSSGEKYQITPAGQSAGGPVYNFYGAMYFPNVPNPRQWLDQLGQITAQADSSGLARAGRFD